MLCYVIFVLVLREKFCCIDPQHGSLVTWLQTKKASFVVSFKIFARSLIGGESKFANFEKFVIFVNPQLSTCLFCHLVFIFAKPINSCQINRHLSRCSFLSSYWNIRQENFWYTHHFCQNFPRSPKICHFLIIAICQDFPLCHLIWGFAKPLMDSCSIPHFLQFAIFVKIANSQ